MASSLFSRYENAQKKYKLLISNPAAHKKILAKRRRNWKKRTQEQKKKDYEYHHRYMSEMREVAKELGKCSICFKEKESPKFRICLRCRIKKRKHNERRRK